MTLRQSCAFAFCWLMASSGCSARDALPRAVPPFAPTPDADFRWAPPASDRVESASSTPDVRSFQLENGLKLHIVERYDLPLASVVYVNSAGSFNESSEQAGLVALTASLLNEGTRQPFSQELTRLNLSGVFPEIETSHYGVTITLNSLATDAEAAVQLLSNIVRYPVFASKAVAEQRDLQREALFRQSTRIMFQLTTAVLGELYGQDVALVRSVLGRSKAISGLGAQAVVDQHRRSYAPENSAVVVVGAVNAVSVRQAVELHFGAWKPASTFQRRAPPRAPAPSAAPYTLHAMAGDKGHAYFVFALPSVGAESPRYPAVALATSFLGGLASSRLNQTLRAHHGATYGIHASYQARAHDGEMLVIGDLRVDELPQALRLLSDEIDRLARTKLTVLELEAAKAGFLHQLAGDRSSNAGLASEIARLHVLGLPVDFYETLASRVSALTAAEFQAAAASSLVSRNGATSLSAHPREARPLLHGFENVEWFSVGETDP